MKITGSMAFCSVFGNCTLSRMNWTVTVYFYHVNLLGNDSSQVMKSTHNAMSLLIQEQSNSQFFIYAHSSFVSMRRDLPGFQVCRISDTSRPCFMPCTYKLISATQDQQGH